jgi:Uma2 family endonuclease
MQEVYYEQRNPKSVISLDIFLIFGVENKKQVSYKLWEENCKVPDFILEITSKTTISEDQGIKKGLYAYLGVTEYFQYDPSSDYLTPSLQGLRLVEGNYFPISPQQKTETGLTIFLEVLGLELQTDKARLNSFPDVIWISKERLATLVDEEGHLTGAPELVIEVLSPGSTNERRDA